MNYSDIKNDNEISENFEVNNECNNSINKQYTVL